MFKSLFNTIERAAIEKYTTADEIFQRIALFMWGFQKYEKPLSKRSTEELKWLALMSRGFVKRIADLASVSKEIREYIIHNNLAFNLDKHAANFTQSIRYNSEHAIDYFYQSLLNPKAIIYTEKQAVANISTQLYCKNANKWADFIEIIPSGPVTMRVPPLTLVTISEPFIIPYLGVQYDLYTFSGEENTPITIRYCLGIQSKQRVYESPLSFNKQGMFFFMKMTFWTKEDEVEWEKENKKSLISRGLPTMV